jgi:uncharacterized protein (DUF736 family)
MATIGKFTKTENGFTGSIRTLTLQAEISIEAVENKSSDKAPDFRVFHLYDSVTSEIGAAWKKTSREGAEYLSVSLDDPSFTARINCSLFKTSVEHTHSLVWERPQLNRKKD